VKERYKDFYGQETDSKAKENLATEIPRIPVLVFAQLRVSLERS
jgi:hypothetical protein